MMTWQVLSESWAWQPTVVLGCLALLAAYVALARPLTARAALFALGDVVILLALVSPLDTLGDTYLFSAHMLQHLLLILVAPPLLLLGVSPRLFERLLRWAPARRVERRLGHPVVAWTLGMGTLWLWHAPVLYQAALGNEGIHIGQHLSFLVSATIFWWPVIAPAPLRRLSSLGAVPYLLASSVTSSVLGVMLTFAPPGLYPFYLHPVDTLGILPVLRGHWGLTMRTDQQLGGLLMWMLSSPIYLTALAAALARWYREPEPDNETLTAIEETRPGESLEEFGPGAALSARIHGGHEQVYEQQLLSSTDC